MYDHTRGKSSAKAYRVRQRTHCMLSAAHSSASAVDPVSTWCAKSHHGCWSVARNAMMAPMRSTYSDHATDHHRNAICRREAYRYQHTTATPAVTSACRIAAWNSEIWDIRYQATTQFPGTTPLRSSQANADE